MYDDTLIRESSPRLVTLFHPLQPRGHGGPHDSFPLCCRMSRRWGGSTGDGSPPFPVSFQGGFVPQLLSRGPGQTPTEKCIRGRVFSQGSPFCLPLTVAVALLMGTIVPEGLCSPPPPPHFLCVNQMPGIELSASHL